jgi:soluble lytic murein transglycosylase
MRSGRIANRQLLTISVAALALALSVSGRAAAAEGGPYPVGPGNRVLSATDMVLLEEANRAADRNDWQTAMRLAGQSSDPIGRRIVEWRYLLDDDSNASFDEISAFLRDYPDWPRREALLARAEEDMPAGLPPSEVLAWFGNRTPETPEGALRLGGALIALGRADEGTAVIRDAWIANTFSAGDERAFLETYSSVLRPDDHQARLDWLLARNDVDDARRQLERVDARARRIAEARITLKSAPNRASQIPASLEPEERNDPWLAYDHARALRRNGEDDAAWAIMRAVQGPLPSPDDWWLERHIMARDALKVHEYNVAYQLAAENYMESGGGFADAEFLAGWIALRHQNQPDIALEHFRTLADGVSFPISRARAHYWSGRALEALGRTEEANASYERAARDSTTYYGQLALTKLSPEPHLLLESEMPDPDRRLDNDDRIRAMNALLDLDRKALLRVFAVHMANEDRSPGRMRYLTDFMSASGDRVMALRLAKMASYSDIMLLPYLDPLVDIPDAVRQQGVEPAFILGLTRQESEFDSDAVSRAGARGLMQLMPATAQITARGIGVAYSQARLTNPDYNIQLGAAHLSDLLERWSGSYVLTIAAYNAGSGNVARWIETYGDPRSHEIDTIDWLELIPFGETRNYVQRVLENIQVYRTRLSGNDHPLEILADLSRSNAPRGPIPLPQQKPTL